MEGAKTHLETSKYCTDIKIVQEKEAQFMFPPLSLPNNLTDSTYVPFNEQQLCAIENIRSMCI